MTTIQNSQEPIIQLPSTPYIDIVTGLKHCNHNRSLYFKVLNNFVKRYQHIDLDTIEDKKRTLHSLKGITATLGMTSLSTQLASLEKSFDSKIINNFKQDLQKVVESIINVKWYYDNPKLKIKINVTILNKIYSFNIEFASDSYV